jgi:DNA-directed RNA polymerase specialized sigma24 family protein
MELLHHLGVSAYDSDALAEDLLVQYDPYIVALVSQQAYGSSNAARLEAGAMDLDDITQRIRIKFWTAVRTRRITHYKAYLRTIVLNEFHDIPRRRASPLPLRTDEDGELYMGDVVTVGSEEADNPEDEYIEGENFRELLETVLPFISEMSPQQRRVLFCRIYEALGERLNDIESFRRCAIGCEVYTWPEDEQEKRLLQASLSAARKNLLKKIDAMLEQCEQMKVPEKIRARAKR